MPDIDSKQKNTSFRSCIREKLLKGKDVFSAFNSKMVVVFKGSFKSG